MATLPHGGTPKVSAENKYVARELSETIIGAIILAAIIFLFVMRAFTVDGPSMQPTLQTGERLLIDKLTYRWRGPHRGDVIVFRVPDDPSQFYIKRVVGLPGDVVQIRRGRLHINGTVVTESYVNGPVFGSYGPVVVPADSYFVLGDNRNNSEDSRSHRIGAVPRNLIVGRALVRYWPLPRTGIIHSDSVVWASVS